MLSEAATSQGYFPKWKLPKRQLSKSVLAAALWPQTCSSRSALPPLQPAAPQKLLGKMPLRKIPTTVLTMIIVYSVI